MPPKLKRQKKSRLLSAANKVKSVASLMAKPGKGSAATDKSSAPVPAPSPSPSTAGKRKLAGKLKSKARAIGKVASMFGGSKKPVPVTPRPATLAEWYETVPRRYAAARVEHDAFDQHYDMETGLPRRAAEVFGSCVGALRIPPSRINMWRGAVDSVTLAPPKAAPAPQPSPPTKDAAADGPDGPDDSDDDSLLLTDASAALTLERRVSVTVAGLPQVDAPAPAAAAAAAHTAAANRAWTATARRRRAVGMREPAALLTPAATPAGGGAKRKRAEKQVKSSAAAVLAAENVAEALQLPETSMDDNFYLQPPISLEAKLLKLFDPHGESAGKRNPFYSLQSLCKRDSLKWDKRVTSKLEKLWKATDVDLSGFIDKDEYLTMHRQMCVVLGMAEKNMLTGPSKSYPKKLIKLAEDDWELDRAGRPNLDRSRFCLCWFQLADRFTSGISGHLYASFLQGLIVELLYEDPADGRWKWKYGFDRDEPAAPEPEPEPAPEPEPEPEPEPAPAPAPAPAPVDDGEERGRRLRAAIVLQAALRKAFGFAAYKRARRGAIGLAALMRGRTGRKSVVLRKASILTMQAGMRGVIARNAAHAAKKLRAVSTIQETWRAALVRWNRPPTPPPRPLAAPAPPPPPPPAAREEAPIIRAAARQIERRAATAAQAVWRGAIARRVLKSAVKAAVAIEAVVRGRSARSRQRTLSPPRRRVPPPEVPPPPPTPPVLLPQIALPVSCRKCRSRCVCTCRMRDPPSMGMPPSSIADLELRGGMSSVSLMSQTAPPSLPPVAVPVGAAGEGDSLDDGGVSVDHVGVGLVLPPIGPAGAASDAMSFVSTAGFTAVTYSYAGANATNYFGDDAASLPTVRSKKFITDKWPGFTRDSAGCDGRTPYRVVVE